jgi:hypothetical protein
VDLAWGVYEANNVRLLELHRDKELMELNLASKDALQNYETEMRQVLCKEISNEQMFQHHEKLKDNYITNFELLAKDCSHVEVDTECQKFKEVPLWDRILVWVVTDPVTSLCCI